MIPKKKIRLIAAPAAILLLITVSAQVLWNSFERSKEASESVEHTYRVLVSSERFLSSVREVESAVRAYVITRNRAFVASYEADTKKPGAILAALRQLTRDNPQQQAALKHIGELAERRMAALDRGFKAIDEGRIEQIPGTARTGRGGQIMTELTARLNDFEENEHRLLALRTDAAADAVSRTRFMLVFTLALLAIALLFAGVLMERDLGSRELANEALRRQADLINFSHDAIVTLDPAGAITGWNAGAVEIYGWSNAEALGRRADEILKTGGGPGLLAARDSALSRDGHWDGELSQTTQDGRSRIVASRSVQVRNLAGQPVGVLNISRDETQRKEAENLLKQVAEQTRLALDAAELGSWDYRVQEDRVTWDERCREILGLPGLGPATLEQSLKVVHPDERQSMRAAALAAFSGPADGRFSHEMRILMRDGSVRWLATYGRVYFEEVNGSRRAARVIGVNSDITERKRVEEALRESEDRLRVALETGRIGIFNDLPMENKIVFDERARQLLGIAAETKDPTPAEFLRLLHPDDRETLRAARDQDLTGPDSVPGEVRYRVAHPSGGVRWMVARRRVYSEGSGAARRSVRVLGILLDVTEQKRAEDELAAALAESDRERRRLAAILETMPTGVVLVNRGNELVEGNAEIVQIWRARDLKELAERIKELKGFRADNGEPIRLNEWPRSRALHGEIVRGETIDIERLDGSKGTVFNFASPVRDAAGGIQGAVTVMVDITQQRRVELELRLAHDDLSRTLEQKNILFKEVQHRVKNNLQVVSSLLSLEAQRFSDREFHDALNESRDRVRSMALMHEKFYHLDDLARIDFAAYVDELARYFFSSYMAEPSAIAFSADVDVRLSMDEAIPCGLILQELLSNSVKHAFPAGRGEIAIRFHSVDGRFELRYRDSGPGLPEKVNLRNPDTLGLQLVSDLADQLRGEIRYEFQQGAQFTLTFG